MKDETGNSMIFIKKPVKIEAIQLTERSIMAVYSFVEETPILDCDMANDRWDDYKDIVKRDGMIIKTLEGCIRASIGDYIIKGVHGAFYPCKPDIFKKTYYTQAEYAEITG